MARPIVQSLKLHLGNKYSELNSNFQFKLFRLFWAKNMRIFPSNISWPKGQSRNFALFQIDRLGQSTAAFFQAQLRKFITTPPSQTLNIVAFVGPYLCDVNTSFTSGLVHLIGLKELVRSLHIGYQNWANGKFRHPFLLSFEKNFDWEETVEIARGYCTDLTSGKKALIEPKFLYQPLAKISAHINFLKNAKDGFDPEKAYRMMDQLYLACKRNRAPGPQSLKLSLSYERLRFKFLKSIVFTMNVIQRVNLASHLVSLLLMMGIGLGLSIVCLVLTTQSMLGQKIDISIIFESWKSPLLPQQRSLAFAVKCLPRLASAHCISLMGSLIAAQTAQIAWRGFCQTIENRAKDTICKYKVLCLKQKIDDLVHLRSTDSSAQVDAVAWHLHMLLICSDIDELSENCTLTCPISYDELKMNEMTAVLDTNLKTPFKGEAILNYLKHIKRVCPTTQQAPKAILFPFGRSFNVFVYRDQTDQTDFRDELKQSRALLSKKFLDEYFKSRSIDQIPHNAIADTKSTHQHSN